MANLLNNILQMNDLIQKMYHLHDDIIKASNIMAECVIYGGTIYVIGNGGSAADANHFTGEILGRFKRERKGLSAISLTADNATITAIANDYGYEHIFSRQLEGLYDPFKDVLFTMSTSGNSLNVVKALDYLDEIGGKSVNLLGRDGGIIAKRDGNCHNKNNIIIPAQDSDRIQEMMKFILHFFAEVIEEEYVKIKGGYNE